MAVSFKRSVKVNGGMTKMTGGRWISITTHGLIADQITCISHAILWMIVASLNFRDLSYPDKCSKKVENRPCFPSNMYSVGIEVYPSSNDDSQHVYNLDFPRQSFFDQPPKS